MRPYGFENGMTASIRESRGYTFEIEWRFQERFFQAVAFFIVETFQIIFCKMEGILLLASMQDIGGINVSDADRNRIDIQFVVVNLESILRLQPEEVYRPSIYVR